MLSLFLELFCTVKPRRGIVEMLFKLLKNYMHVLSTFLGPNTLRCVFTIIWELKNEKFPRKK